MARMTRRQTTRRPSARLLASKALSAFLIYLGVGLSHHLYLEMRFQGDRMLNLDQRDDTAANLARRPRQPDVAATLVDLSVAGRSCTAVPIKGTGILLTAAHCVVDDDYRPVAAGNLTADFGIGDERRSEPLTGAEIVVHPRYQESASLTPPSPVERMLLSAFTWATVRGADRDASPYRWDVAAIRTPGRTWSFGVDGVTSRRDGPYLIEAYQNFSLDGTPICTLELPENCAPGTLPSEAVAQVRDGVRCSAARMGRPAQLDGWFPCAIMPGGSGGAVIVARGDQVLLLGLVTGGDEWGEGNGVTIDAVAGFTDSLLP